MRRMIITMALLALSVLSAQAQSDTPLDRTRTLSGIHKELIGQDHCIKCHDATQRADDAKCLKCHEEIQSGLDRGAGYHYRVVTMDDGICESCHKEHRGEIEKLATWHDDESMKRFEHTLTGYELDGSHIEQDCVKCHEPSKVAAVVSQRQDLTASFIGLQQDCMSCHEDVHLAKLGVDCLSCHDTGKWPELLPEALFDHAKVDYQLEGMHADLKCEVCHKTERQLDPIEFAACLDCHEDSHAGQLADREDKGKCESCHDVKGFMPAAYDLTEHAESRFPLAGLHQAVSCKACHETQVIEGVETARFDYESRGCEDCHEDPRAGHSSQVAETYGCQDCHVDTGWRERVYDHDRSEFKLTGGHDLLACELCHETRDPGLDSELVLYRDIGKDCFACHGGTHAGQFAEDSCEQCHDTENWRPDRFDHQVASTYKLEGKHLDAECETCHHMEQDSNGKAFRRLKPLGAACVDCHDAGGSVLPELGLMSMERGEPGR